MEPVFSFMCNKTPYTMTTVNVVGNGNLYREVDLQALQTSLIDFEDVVEAVSKQKSGLVVKFSGYEGTITVFRTGKYTIMGSSGEKKLKSLNNAFVSKLHKLNILEENVSFNPTNYVYSVDLSQEIDLNWLAAVIGAEAEFEPEQYAHLIYKPADIDATMTIAANGKCVVNASRGEQGVHEIIHELEKYLSKSD